MFQIISHSQLICRIVPEMLATCTSQLLTRMHNKRSFTYTRAYCSHTLIPFQLKYVPFWQHASHIDARYIPIIRSDTQQAEVSHVLTHITHTLLYSRSAILAESYCWKMRHLNCKLVFNDRYIKIARSNTQQAEVSRIHTHIIHPLLNSLRLKLWYFGFLTAGSS